MSRSCRASDDRRSMSKPTGEAASFAHGSERTSRSCASGAAGPGRNSPLGRAWVGWSKAGSNAAWPIRTWTPFSGSRWPSAARWSSRSGVGIRSPRPGCRASRDAGAHPAARAAERTHGLVRAADAAIRAVALHRRLPRRPAAQSTDRRRVLEHDRRHRRGRSIEHPEAGRAPGPGHRARRRGRGHRPRLGGPGDRAQSGAGRPVPGGVREGLSGDIERLGRDPRDTAGRLRANRASSGATSARPDCSPGGAASASLPSHEPRRPRPADPARCRGRRAAMARARGRGGRLHPRARRRARARRRDRRARPRRRCPRAVSPTSCRGASRA